MAAGVLYPTMTQADEWSEQAAAQPRGMFLGTPEIYFAKRIDNSRVAKVTDPKRRREMMSFGITLGVLFLFVMVYLWQHFSAIEYGYRIEQLKAAARHHRGIKPRVESGRGFAERSGANRCPGPEDGHAAAGGGTSGSPWTPPAPILPFRSWRKRTPSGWFHRNPEVGPFAKRQRVEFGSGIQSGGPAATDRLLHVNSPGARLFEEALG